jgi:hypothetical protein
MYAVKNLHTRIPLSTIVSTSFLSIFLITSFKFKIVFKKNSIDPSPPGNGINLLAVIATFPELKDHRGSIYTSGEVINNNDTQILIYKKIS